MFRLSAGYGKMSAMRKLFILLPFALLAATGCDQVNQKLGLEDPAKKEARQEAEGKAVGSACRHSGRAIEDCYSIYAWLPKAAIYEGWREMDAYMRDNQIESVAPQLPPPEPPGAKKKKKAGSEGTGEEAATAKGTAAASEGKPAEKGGEKSADRAGEKTGDKEAAKH